MLDRIPDDILQSIYRLHVSPDFHKVMQWLGNELKENDKYMRHAESKVEIWQGRGQAIEAILKAFTDAPNKVSKL